MEEYASNELECDVILRTCSEVYAVHPFSTGKSNEYHSRMVGSNVSKSEIILRSLNSLIETMNHYNGKLRLIIVDDHSSHECLENMKKLLEKCKFPAEIINTEEKGVGASLKTAYDWALKNSREVLFFVEDDYFHDLICIEEMIESYKIFKEKLKHEIALFPCDYPDNYNQSKYSNLPSRIILGKKRHWRTIVNSTCTFLCSLNLIKDYWEYFELMTHYQENPNVSEETTYNKIWKMPYVDGKGAILLSPIPSLSVHLQYATDSEDQRSPFIDWKEWWELANPEFEIKIEANKVGKKEKDSKKEYLSFFEKKYKEKLQENPVFQDRYNGFKKIFEELLKKKSRNFTIIETGTLRKEDSWTDGQSSLLFFEFLSIFGGELITIDIDKSALLECKDVLSKKIGLDKAKLILVHGNSVEQLTKIDEEVDLVYLDSFDFNHENPMPSMVHHLKELASIGQIISKSKNLIIAVDDNFELFGKGKFLNEWAKETKKEILHEGYQLVFCAHPRTT